jgi:hypothetical protein
VTLKLHPSGQTTSKPVELLHSNHDTDLADITVKAENSKTETLHTTWHHPFWSASTETWTDADHLAPGTLLHTADGHAELVITVRTWVGQHEMRDLTVADIHTYYVLAGNTPVLVHNCDIPWSSGRVSAASRALGEGGTKITVGSRSEAEELFLRKYQGEGYRNASGFDGVGTKQYFGEKRGTYHWDDQVGADGRVVGHGPGNVDGALPHLQVHTFNGPIVRIFWGG